MINYDSLIHNREYFTFEHIAARQKEYNFTQAVKVETFLWDIELYGQLQKYLGEKVTLKGGAAAQLFFPPEKQRTSVDIDVIYVGNKDELHAALDAIHQAFGGDETFFRFQPLVPKEPTTVLPMETYNVAVPSLTKVGGTLFIKVDFHFMDKLELDSIELEFGSAFVLTLKFKPRCLSRGSLLGDKLLTFARGSVGIPEERQDDIMKQLYDVDLLSRIISHEETSSMQRALSILFEKELSAREKRIEFSEALQQIAELLSQYANVNNPTCAPEIKKGIDNFRGNYEPRPFRNPIEWEVSAKRIQFLVHAISENPNQSIAILKEGEEIEAALNFSGGPNRMELRKLLADEFLEMLRTSGQTSIAKRIKSNPLERVYWEVVRPSNLDAIKQRVQSKIHSLS
ncbi:MAG: nucleotidyl transferase AbiEii/AbiGii toxin family protein [Bacteroidota bacterium]